jgi:hypothetical protein
MPINPHFPRDGIYKGLCGSTEIVLLRASTRDVTRTELRSQEHALTHIAWDQLRMEKAANRNLLHVLIRGRRVLRSGACVTANKSASRHSISTLPPPNDASTVPGPV